MDIIIPNTTEMWVNIVAFVVVFFVLAKFAFPPITKMLDERATKIRESLEKAEDTRVEAERLLDEYKTQMADARAEAAQVIEQGRKVAESMKAEILAKAREEAEAEKAKAVAAITAEKESAMAELKGEVADLSVAVAGKIIGSSLSKADHEALIDKYLAEVGSLNEN
ncbi:MAG TPA: ATP synthase F0 subunit B [Coriobacteriia bacterium]|uniref:F0F1 ATP synthase subunit B n=1 Tax=Anaerosoma tenue TaxID=2933588 RepID=UPI00076DDCA2|nr:F0F1 ATP synthase subunit B [Anaerosoma tenue]KUK48892.1 MAG: ATP synthase subunit b [Actinobacteria bacterium 66_15]MCK8114606.1 F0F1 ATP synthase subunit B [Anaerosoma tenue]HAL29919.1 ATP synthase F0 subunit B [Coriobacteriia bacterium]